MPITQERFLDFIEGALSYVKAIATFRTLLRRAEDLASNTRQALEYEAEGPVKDLLREHIALLTMCSDIVRDTTEPEFEAKVMFEQKYFTRNFRRNAKQAAYQRQWRLEKGITQNPVPRPMERVADTYEAAPTWQPDIESAARAIRETKAQEAKDKLEAARAIARSATARQKEIESAQRSSNEAAATTTIAHAHDSSKLNHPAGHSYDPSALRTSVPSLAELNAADVVPPGEDVL